MPSDPGTSRRFRIIGRLWVFAAHPAGRGGDPALAEDYYRQARIVADVPGRPMAETLAAMKVTGTARGVADAVLRPRRLRDLFPALAVFRLVTTALLPERLREEFGPPQPPPGGPRPAAAPPPCSSVPPPRPAASPPGS
ncbi:hypothetical protein [Spirillospora sp. CA-128828]|uniref:hypothetical protein n=1 Tax=Spirillospora sp. CA-128828 TaxID=3240033 RepID=UPI003D90C6A6